MSQDNSLLSSIGRMLFSRACNFGESLSNTANQIRLNTKFDQILSSDSVYLVSHTFFSSLSIVKFSTGYRLNKGTSPKIYLKIDAGIKQKGQSSTTRDLKGFQVDDDVMIKIWSFCTKQTSRIFFSQSGFEEKNPVDVEFTSNSHEGSLLKIQMGGVLIQHKLSDSNLMDIQSCILAAKQIKYHYLTDTAVLHMLSSLADNSSTFIPRANSSPSDSISDIVSNAFDQIIVPGQVKTKAQFRSWVMKQLPGMGITSVQSKALWAIGNQKLGGDKIALSNISVIQNVSSHGFAGEIIARVNAGDIAFLKDMVLKEYTDE